jgi:hypothetical protein
MPDIGAKHHVDDVFGDILTTVSQTLQRTGRPDQLSSWRTGLCGYASDENYPNARQFSPARLGG